MALARLGMDSVFCASFVRVRFVKLAGGKEEAKSALLRFSLGTAESGRAKDLEAAIEPKPLRADGGRWREMLLLTRSGGSLPMIFKMSSSRQGESAFCFPSSTIEGVLG